MTMEVTFFLIKMPVDNLQDFVWSAHLNIKSWLQRLNSHQLPTKRFN